MTKRLSGNGTSPNLAKTEDRRTARTRQALLMAFTSLFFERGYNQIKVADIIARADVGRSTFYEHFADKEAILSESMRGRFAPLAALVDPKGDAELLPRVLAHFWQNQLQARLILTGPARRPVGRILASMIDERLRARPLGAIPSRLVAIALADAQLGAIAAWLSGEVACDPHVLAESLRRMMRGALDAL